MKRWPEYAVIAGLIATLTFAVLAQPRSAPPPPGADEAAAEPDNSFAIRDVRVFDGERVIEHANVIVRDGRIAAVGADAPIPDGLDAIDGAGKTLLPGLIDAHTHSWGHARADALRFGVTTELDMLGDWHRLPRIEDQRQSLARTTQADLWSAGAAVTVPGGHGTQYGGNVPTLAPDEDAGAFVAARVEEGSDYIKIIVENLSAHGTDRRMPTLTPTQVSAAIDAAHDHDKQALVHVSRRDDALHAVRSGADGLVHLFIDEPVDAAFVRAAREHEAFVIPTLSVLTAGAGARLADDPRLRPWLSGEQLASLKQPGFSPALNDPQLLDQLLAGVGKLHEAGVPVLAGTDAGNPGTAHGASLHGELELLTRAGLSPVEALAAATSATAERFGLDDRGRIAPGLRADLLLVRGDPTHDITATRDIVRVWKNGYPVDRALADSAKPAVRGAAAPDATVISDFDDGDLDVAFGSGWQPTTDAIMGGTSSVEHEWVAGGAQDSAGALAGALAIRGTVRPGRSPWATWAGMMLMLGESPMQPVDLSGRHELVFHARGDGREYQVMLFSGPSARGRPSVQSFVAGPQWQQVRIPLSEFAGADPSLLRAIAFTAGAPAGEFALRIDQVELR